MSAHLKSTHCANVIHFDFFRGCRLEGPRPEYTVRVFRDRIAKMESIFDLPYYRDNPHMYNSVGKWLEAESLMGRKDFGRAVSFADFSRGLAEQLLKNGRFPVRDFAKMRNTLPREGIHDLIQMVRAAYPDLINRQPGYFIPLLNEFSARIKALYPDIPDEYRARP